MPLDHYVSQVHLKKFCSPVLGDRMYAMRKSESKLFTPTPRAVCGISDGSTNAYLKEDRAIEEFLKTIEPNYNAVVAKVIGGAIDDECIYTIAGFAAFVICCSPAGMRLKSSALKSNVEAEAAILDARGLFPQTPKGLGGRSVTELLRTGVLRVKIDPKFPQAIGISSIMKMIATFGNFGWDILINDFERSPFFTSDFPVPIEETRDRRIVNRIVPLAPSLAVRIRPDFTIDVDRADLSFANFVWRRKRVSHREVVEINRLIVRSAEDTVFWRDHSEWVQRFVVRNRTYRIESKTQTVPMRSGVAQFTNERIAKFNGFA
jgi:Protein of unknown function (DUF4238)